MDAQHSVSVATGCRSRPDCIVKRGFPEQSWLASFAFPAPASTHLFYDKQRGKAKKEERARLSNSSAGGGSSLSWQNEEEGNVLQDIATLFCDSEQLKTMVDSSLNSGVGPDMRNRVDHLLKRIGMLKQSAERAASVGGGRVPSQLVASLKGLQREHSSLENIVRLATEAGPVTVEMDSKDQEEYSQAMAAQKGTLSMRYGADSMVGDLAQGQRNETFVEVLSGPKYVMSTPPNESSSNLAAVRAEIERRVMEQLVKKQVNQPIFRSGEDFTNGNKSKLTNLQKVPSVNGQRRLDSRSEVDTAIMLGGKGFLPQKVEARQLDQSPMLDAIQNPDLKARRLEMENTRMIPLELHEQMVSKFEKDLVFLREQLSQVTEDLKQKEDTLVAVKEKLMSEQSKLSEKINELAKEIVRRSTAEDLKHALVKTLEQMEKDLKGTQNQVESLGFELEKRERFLEDFREEQKRTNQELQAGILSLNGKLSHIERLYEEFDPQRVIVDLGSVKGTLSALQKDQVYVQAQMVDWKENMGTLERSVGSNDKEIKELTNEVDSRVRKGEVNDVLKKVMDEVDKQGELLQNHIKFIGVEQEKNETSVGLLQQDWKTYRKELQGHIEAVKSKLIFLETVQSDLNVQGVLTELSNRKNKLTDLQEERKHEQASILEAQQQMVVLEGKGSDLLKRMSEEAETQRQILMAEVRTSMEEDVLTELSNVKNKLIDLQEEQKHEQSLILEVQQKMVVLEGKGSDLLKKMSEEAETQRKILMDEVRTSVEELLKASHVSPSNGIENALSIEESDAMKNVRHLEDFVNDSDRGISSSELNTNVVRDQQHETTLHGGVQQVPDKRTASLEAFFSVMGQLIREELKRMDGTSAQTLPLSAEPTQYFVSSHVHGSGGTHKDGEDLGNNSIRLLYDSSWNRAFVHYCADKIGWTEVPGVPMQEASNVKGKSWKEFRIKATRLEFVVTDGQGNWDRAPNGCNYILEKPGVFELSAGVLKPTSTV